VQLAVGLALILPAALNCSHSLSQPLPFGAPETRLHAIAHLTLHHLADSSITAFAHSVEELLEIITSVRVYDLVASL